MNYMQRILTEFQHILKEFNHSPPMQRLRNGDITLEHYKSLMRQIFHHARENPQIQAMATVYFRGRQRDAIKMFYRHAISEIGHDQLALNDLASCNEDVSQVPYENPLPDTTALLAFGFYQIQNLDPVGYLGYLFFLEFTPTHAGKDYLNWLAKIGAPQKAMTFLVDHVKIDTGHNKMMEAYVSELVTTEAELQMVIYAMKVTAHLYMQMIQGAFRQVDFPQNYGVSMPELGKCKETNEAKKAVAVPSYA